MTPLHHHNLETSVSIYQQKISDTVSKYALLHSEIEGPDHLLTASERPEKWGVINLPKGDVFTNPTIVKKYFFAFALWVLWQKSIM